MQYLVNYGSVATNGNMTQQSGLEPQFLRNHTCQDDQMVGALDGVTGGSGLEPPSHQTNDVPTWYMSLPGWALDINRKGQEMICSVAGWIWLSGYDANSNPAKQYYKVSMSAHSQIGTPSSYDIRNSHKNYHHNK